MIKFQLRYFWDLLAIISLFLLSYITIDGYLANGFIIAGGDSSIYMNPRFIDYFSAWNDRVNFGAPSFHQSNLILFYYFWEAVKWFTSIDPSIVYIFCSTFLAGLFFYICSRTLLKNIYPPIILVASVMYTFNLFRILGPLNERLNLLFIFLPLFFFYYHKLLETKKNIYLFIIAILSILSSSLGANLPLLTIPYLMMGIYLLFHLFITKDRQYKKLIFLHSVLGLLLLLVNIFWIIPLMSQLSDQYKQTGGGVNLFRALASGNFYDHYRFLGSWGWQSSHYQNMYYPFALGYYQIPLIISTYIVAFFSFLTLVAPDKAKSKLGLFFILLALVSLFLLAGTKGPFSYLHSLLYTIVSPFRMYREPFTKFMPLFIFGMSFNLIYGLDYICSKIKHRLYNFLLVVLVGCCVLFNAMPMFDKTAMPERRWNGGQWGNKVLVPEYWPQAVNYITIVNDPTKNLLATPYAPYSSSYNWQYGTNVVGTMADYLYKGDVIRAWDNDKTPSGLILQSIYGDDGYGYNFKNLIGLLNVDYILQQNDLEWRYSSKTKSPNDMQKFFAENEVSLETTFGQITKDDLNNIPNTEMNGNLRDELNSQLIGKPNLLLYKNNPELNTGLIYGVKQLTVGSLDTVNLKYLVSFENYNKNFAYIKEDIKGKADPEVTAFLNNKYNFEYINITTESAKIRQRDLAWNSDKYSWPEANTDPNSLLYKLVIFKENFNKYKLRDQKLSSIDLLIWLSMKRISEIQSYVVPTNKKHYLVEAHIKDLTKAFSIIETYPEDDRNKEYWEQVKKIYLYIERAEKTLDTLGLNSMDKEQITKLYAKIRDWVDVYANTECEKKCYVLKPSKTGDYSLYINKKAIENHSSAIISLFEATNNNFLQTLNLTNEEDYWYSTNPVYLENTKKYRLEIADEDRNNLLAIGQWNKYDTIKDDQSEDLNFRLDNIFKGYTYIESKDGQTEPNLYIWKDSIRYKNIDDWQAYGSYKIAFDFTNYKGVFGVALIEEFPDYKIDYNKALLNENNDESVSEPYTIYKEVFNENLSDYVSYVEDKNACYTKGSCKYHFEKIVKASRGAIGAKLYYYAYNIADNFSTSNIDIMNSQVTHELEPKLMARLVNTESNLETATPDIIFSPKSDVEYSININNMQDDFILVFNKNFDSGWKLIYNNKIIADHKHLTVNGYANAWLLSLKDFNDIKDGKVQFTLKYEPQTKVDIFRYISYSVSAILILLIIINLIINLFIKRK